MISERIYKIMGEKLLKQSLVAKAAGYGVKEFNNMLRGRKHISPEDILRLCEVLDVTPNEIYGYKKK